MFNEGTHYQLYNKLGAHPVTLGGVQGTHFAVWAPNAQFVSVMGSFNGWKKGTHALRSLGSSGIWAGFLPGVGKGDHYKYHIVSRYEGFQVEKADPFALFDEAPPRRPRSSGIWSMPGAIRTG